MTHDHTHDHEGHSDGHHTHSHSHSHAHSHDHGHSHGSHSHRHSHGDDASEMDLKEKLQLLLKHWVDHNNSHKDTYLSWAKKAEAEKLTDVARHLEAADEASAVITAHLEEALKLLNG